MYELRQFDRVRILIHIPDEGISKGQIGYILEVYDETHYEVEISDSNGNTLLLGSLPADLLEVV